LEFHPGVSSPPSSLHGVPNILGQLQHSHQPANGRDGSNGGSSSPHFNRRGGGGNGRGQSGTGQQQVKRQQGSHGRNYMDMVGLDLLPHSGQGTQQPTWQQVRIRNGNGSTGGGRRSGRSSAGAASTAANLDLVASTVSDALDVYPSVYANPNPASLPGGHNSGEGCNVSNHSGVGGGTASQTPSVRALAGSLASFENSGGSMGMGNQGPVSGNHAGAGGASLLGQEENENSHHSHGSVETANSEHGDTGSATYSEASSKN